MERRDWPPLPLAEWEPTYRTLHRFTQVVGKVQLALAPPINHWWHITFHVNARGLMTAVPCGTQHLTMTFDFVDHRLLAETPDRGTLSLALEPMTVAAFHERVLAMLDQLGVRARVWPVPVEVDDPIPFPQDVRHASYDRDQVARLHRILLASDRLFNLHRGRFVGKSSPVHFFWGGFDLAVTRFSGKRNPNPPPDRVNREAYSHEVISHGFWPGGPFLDRGRVDEPVYYAYAVPEPAGFRDARVDGARYDERFGEWILPYEAVRTAKEPDATLLSFMETTYRAAARAAGWNVADLEASPANLSPSPSQP